MSDDDLEALFAEMLRCREALNRAQEEYARAQDRYWLAWSNGVLRQCLARQTNKETAAAEARKRPGWHPEEEHRREVGGD